MVDMGCYNISLYVISHNFALFFSIEASHKFYNGKELYKGMTISRRGHWEPFWKLLTTEGKKDKEIYG